MTQFEIINADIPITEIAICYECQRNNVTKLAVSLWPINSVKPRAYCWDCLDMAKSNLSIALGLKSAP